MGDPMLDVGCFEAFFTRPVGVAGETYQLDMRAEWLVADDIRSHTIALGMIPGIAAGDTLYWAEVSYAAIDTDGARWHYITQLESSRQWNTAQGRVVAGDPGEPRDLWIIPDLLDLDRFWFDRSQSRDDWFRCGSAGPSRPG